MKIVLFALNGSYAHSSLSIRCLREALSSEGFPDTVLCEGTLRDRTGSLLARLSREDADCYGFSCYIWNIREMLALAADLHALRPRCRIFLGGPEVSYESERFTALPFVDCVLTGEGEVSVPALARLLRDGRPWPRLMHGEPDPHFEKRGILYRVGEPVTPLVYYESSRGCPFSCAFCLSSATEGVRAKSAEKALADLLEFEAFRQPLTVKLVDRTFNFDRERAKKILRGLLSPAYTKCYHLEICAALLDDECFEILSAFPRGKIRLEIGLQSINPQTLRAIGRSADAGAVLKAAARLRAPGNLHVHLDLIAGLPFEDFASFGRSFDAAYPVCDVLQLGFLKLLHGTALRREAAANGTVFSAEPPYTVLSTEWLSFEEMCRLHAISDLTERLLERGRFCASVDFLLSRLPSPFAFFLGLSEEIERADGREIQQISQRDLYCLLEDYGRRLLPQAEAQRAFSDKLRADFSGAEVRRPPVSRRKEKK